uniref:Uncharacterized protein n=1 Tax=Avena sativa TaxID=4498 RepID=A0ACD5UNZ3_AVESA
MVQFTKYTQIKECPGLEENYPFCTYSLTAFVDIPRPGGKPRSFVDVIGKITSISDVVRIQSMHQVTPSNTRTIMLEDLYGVQMRLVLWGDRAVEFDADTVCSMGEKEPVIAIFVGTLPKMAFGVKGLSGSTPCHWYIDEDILDINSFRESLGSKITPLASFDSTGPGALVPRVHEDPIDKTIAELDSLNPFIDLEKRFYCTVNVTRVDPDHHWWFASCAACRKSARHDGFQFHFLGDACSSINADLAYCVSVFASDGTIIDDGTPETEFVVFDKVAAGALGKPLFTILCQRYPRCTTSDGFASAAKYDAFIPPEVTRLIGKKYKRMVSISKK